MSQLRLYGTCLCMLALVGCGEEDPSTALPAAGPQRDMSVIVADQSVPNTADVAVNMGDAMLAQDTGSMSPLDMGMSMATQAPNFGELVVNEVMYDPKNLEDDNAEWIELKNISGRDLNLNGCSVVDGDHRDALEENAVSLNGLVVADGGYILVARSEDPNINGGLQPDGVFNFGLSNSGDEIFIVCGNIEVDVVAYDDGETFPNAKGFSILRGQDSSGAERWCPASSIYDENSGEKGTPGRPNDECGVLESPACWAQIDCPMGVFCMSGLCGLPAGTCRDANDCVDNEICESGRCVSAEPPCQMDADCPNAQRCGANGCEPIPVYPTPMRGEVVISEIMYNPHGPMTANRLEDNKAEWLELTNLTDQVFSLSECLIQDASDAFQQLDRLVLPASGRVLISRSLDPSENGGLFPQFRFDFTLNNSSGGELLRLTCGDIELDLVEFSNPTEPAQAYQRSLSDLNGPNELDSVWCGATAVYLEDPQHRGTPLRENTECAD